MLILNTYISSNSKLEVPLYIVAGTTRWFIPVAVKYLYNFETPKLRTSYLSNFEVMQRVSAKGLVKVGKYETV